MPDIPDAVEDVDDLDGNIPSWEITRLLKSKYDLSGKEAARVVNEYRRGELNPEELEKSISRRRLLKKGGAVAGFLTALGVTDYGMNAWTDDALIDDWDHMNDETVREAANGYPVDVALLNYSDSDINEDEVASAFQELDIDVRPNLVQVDEELPEQFIREEAGVENYPSVDEFAASGTVMNDWDGRTGEIPHIVLYDEMPFDAVSGNDGLEPQAEYAFVDSSQPGKLTENEVIRQLGYKLGLEEVDSPVYGDFDVMGSSPARNELGKHFTLGFTKPSRTTWNQIRNEYME